MSIKNITPERLMQFISISICFILAIKINHPHVCMFFSTCTIILILMAAYEDTVYGSDIIYIKDLLLPFSNILEDYDPDKVIEPSYAYYYRDSIALMYENRIFSNGSIIIERDTRKRKIADGKTKYNDLPYEKENIENEVCTSVVTKSKYRQNLLYDTLVADLFIKKSIDELIEEDVILSDRSAIVITDCKYVACIIGDDKTHAVDLYIKSLEYVRDEIRVDEEDEINKHEHVIFIFDDFDLRYHDTRKFGRMKIILKSNLSTTLEIQNSMEHLSDCVDKVQEIDSALKNISEEVNVSIEQINQQIDQFNV